MAKERVEALVEWGKKSIPAIATQSLGEHFSERLKNPKQVKPELSYWVHGRHIIQNRGWMGFLDGLKANAARTFSRHGFRNPILLGTKECCDSILSEETRQAHPNLSKHLGMGAIVVADMALITPAEVAKTVRMTEQGKPSSLVTLVKQHGFSYFYRGVGVFGFRQTQYFGISIAGEEAAKRYFGQDKLSLGQRVVSAFCSSLCYVTVSTLPDAVKTRLQMHNSPYKTVGEALHAVGTTFKKEGVKAGIRGMQAGAGARVVLATFSTGVNMFVFNNTLSHSKIETTSPKTAVTTVTSHESPEKPVDKSRTA